MAKLQIHKPKILRPITPEYSIQSLIKSAFELSVPGTGRVRTSCNHENFHAILRKKEVIAARKKVTSTQKSRKLVKVQ